ncbi:MAG TPA: hypothetical protein VKU82_00185, partial [Planctomycetaceae bacterium]|nr:hypothetical protein [Planctomycetaceae bacterium]
LEAPVHQNANILFNRAFTCGHFVLVSVGTQLVGIDTLGTPDQPGARLLWRSNFSYFGRQNIPPRIVGGNFRRRPMPLNQIGEQVGTIGPVTRDHVALLSGHKLTVLDSLSGKPLWTREGVASGTDLFGDDELLLAVPADAGPAAVYSALDGTVLGHRALPPSRTRLETVGRNVITWGAREGRSVLALRDAWTSKDLWSRPFEEGAQVTLIELDEAAVLEPSGKFTVVSLNDGASSFEGPAEIDAKVRQIHVIRSREHYILIANHVTNNAVSGWQQVTPQAIAVQGWVSGYARATGKHWTTFIDRQGIDLHQPQNLPVLTFMCHFTTPRKNAAALDNHFGLTCLDKRTGRIIFDERDLDEHLYFVEYVTDIEQKHLDLRLFGSVLRLTFTDKPIPDE